MTAVGETLGGKYRLDRLLGQGGMGAVYAAENLNTGRRVAVKVLHGQWMQRPEVAQRFIREARATTAIAHPNIVEVLDLDTDAARGITYIVQEFLEGETLEAHLAAQPGRRLAAREALAIAVPVMGALVAAHERGIVHRDLKPANLFLVRARNGEVVPKVIDFGIAKDVAAAENAAHRTQEGSAIGTPSYMSPEQVSGQTDVDAQTDVWSLGVVLYEMLSGRLPFESPNVNVLMAKILLESPTPLGAHLPDVPADLAEIVAIALRRERGERFGSVRAMLSAVLECADSPAARSSLPPEAAPLRARTVPPSPSVHATQRVEGMATPHGGLVHATQPVQGMAAPHVTQALQSPASNPWSAGAPVSAVPQPDTMNAVARAVTSPGAVTPGAPRRYFAVGAVVALVGLAAALWAQGSSPAAPVVVPVTAVMAPAPVVPAVVAPAPVAPAVVAPAVVAPAPVAPAPVAAPVAVVPVAPVVAAPAPVAPAVVAAPARQARVIRPAPTGRVERPHGVRSRRAFPQGTLFPMPTPRPAPNRSNNLNADEM
jgi:serine/threonine protein kinase